MTRTIDTLRAAMPGLLLSATIALAVRFVSDRLGGPLQAAIFCGLESRYSVSVLRQAR
jgi:hypothetical protein